MKTTPKEIDLELLRCLDSEEARDIAQIKALLDAGADPNLIHWGGRFNQHLTPLLALVQHRDPDPEPELLTLLIERGADPNLTTPEKKTALHSTARYNFISLSRLLLRAGADPNTLQDGYNNGAPIHQVISTHKDNAIECVTLLLDAGANPNLHHQGRTPLRRAIEAQAWEVVRLLLSREALPDHDTPESLFYAEGSISAALKANASEEQLRWLAAQGASPRHRDSNGNTALLHAAWSLPALIPALIELGSDIEERNQKGCTALLYHVLLGGPLEGLTALLAARANKDAQDPEGRTALWFAVDKQKEDLVKALLQAGADRTLATKAGQRPLDLAKSRSLDLLVAMLDESGAAPTSTLIQTILHSIEVGRTLQSERETIALSHLYEGAAYFNYTHQDNPNKRTQLLQRSPIKQRLAWLAMHRPSVLRAYLQTLPEALRVSSLDEAAITARIKEEDPSLSRLASLSIEGTDLGEMIAAGLWAGASLGRSDKEGFESWQRTGDAIVNSGGGEYGDFSKSYSRQEAAAYWRSWGTIADGLVFPGYSFPSALDEALKALGANSLREYLQAKTEG